MFKVVAQIPVYPVVSGFPDSIPANRRALIPKTDGWYSLDSVVEHRVFVGNSSSTYLPRFDGISAFLDSQIWDNGNLIGFGTNAPAANYHFKRDQNEQTTLLVDNLTDDVNARSIILTRAKNLAASHILLIGSHADSYSPAIFGAHVPGNHVIASAGTPSVNLGNLLFAQRNGGANNFIGFYTGSAFLDSSSLALKINSARNIAVGGDFTPSSRLHVRGSGDTSATFAFAVQSFSSNHIFQLVDNGSVQIGHTYNDGFNNTNLLDIISPTASTTIERFSVGFDNKVYAWIDPGSTVAGAIHFGRQTNFYSLAGNPGISDINPYNTAKNFGWIWDPVLGTDFLYSLLNFESSTRIISFHQNSNKVGLGTGIALPTSSFHVKGANGYTQFRLELSYTPTGTADANGSVGDVAWDDSYVYIKTSVGWKRSDLVAF